MTPKRGELYRELRDKGLTYEEIGKIYGVSRQAVWTAITNLDRPYRLRSKSEAAIHKIKYIGLANWMLKNRVSIDELDRRCGSSKLYVSLVGEYEPSKKNIDAILRVTGSTYEECFRERETE